jgi:hypothetical protein
MELGASSIGLTVKDIAASRAFDEALGFTVFGGEQAQHWLIMRDRSTRAHEKAGPRAGLSALRGAFDHSRWSCMKSSKLASVKRNHRFASRRKLL